MRQSLGPGALGRPRGIGWRGKWEGGSGWGTHVNPWLFHFNVWQNPLQLKKKNLKRVSTCIIDSCCCIPETQHINQLYPNEFFKKHNWQPHTQKNMLRKLTFIYTKNCTANATNSSKILPHSVTGTWHWMESFGVICLFLSSSLYFLDSEELCLGSLHNQESGTWKSHKATFLNKKKFFSTKKNGIYKRYDYKIVSK